MSMYDDYGDPVQARDVLDGDELTSYYAARRNRPGPGVRAPRQRWLRSDDGWVSEDGGATWRHEGEAS